MSASKPIRHIRPKQALADWLRHAIDRRQTLWFFIWKDLKVQYQKPIFGLLWSVFQPLVYFGIILAVMHFSGRSSEVSDMPFALYLISGLAIWNFSTSAILGSLNSLQSNSGIITKSFFPRIYLILAPVLKSTVDLFIMVLIVVGIALYFGQAFSASSLVFVPIAILISWLTTLGWSALAASMTMANRHIRHVVPVLLYAMIFALPVFYSMRSMESELIQNIYLLNPIAGAMDCLRVGFGGEWPSSTQFLFWATESILWLGIGVASFRRMEKTLADKL